MSNPLIPHDPVLAATIVEFLDGLIKIDPDGMTDLVAARVPCNGAMADHPSVQVDAETMTFGFLGILNGLCGSLEDGWGAVSVILDGDGNAIGAKVLTPEDRTMPNVSIETD